MACSNCFRGGISTAEPTGTENTIHGLPTYVARPPDDVIPKGIVVFIPDAFGWAFVNNRALCDRYAKDGGFLVYLPEFMNGHALDPKVIGLMDHLLEPAPTWTSFFAKPSSLIKIIYQALPFIIRARISVTWPGVLSFLQAIRSSPPPFPTTSSLKVGAAGFCWGGRHAINLSHDDPATRVASPETTEPQRLVDAVFTHPSMLRLPRDIEKVRVPTSVAIGDVDAVVKAKDALEMKRILDDKDGHEMRIEPGAKHGFSIRMHPEDEHEMECAERAEKQAISWFNKQLV